MPVKNAELTGADSAATAPRPAFPATILAVQLTGPKTLVLNRAKRLAAPGAHQLLCRVEVVGLCFSDLKLLHQFSDHVRKSEVVTTLSKEVLAEVPSYVPGDKATVPGHEVVVTVVAAGPETKTPIGTRALVQTDYRWLKTASSNAAFGYNFEGALQEYVLMDERVVTSPEGESMLIPVDESRGSSAISLVEPWACVEDAYVWPERNRARTGGRMLVVVDAGHSARGVAATFEHDGPPREIVAIGAGPVDSNGTKVSAADSIEAASGSLGGAKFDDIIYFGSDKATLEKLDPLLAKNGLMNIVQGGAKFGASVSIGVGRIHYGGTRFCGTTGEDAFDSLSSIPLTPEIRKGDKILVVGAAGPMGVMHVIRNLCQGVAQVEVVATDHSDERLAALDKRAVPIAERIGLNYRSFNANNSTEQYEATYAALMVPIPALVAQAVRTSGRGAIINIFAGIPASVWHEVDLDTYIARGQYFVGTSGSNLEDMRIVLGKVLSGALDTNISVAAVSGMAGAVDGIAAVEDSIAGKILVYPQLHDMPLTPLEDLKERCPAAYAKLKDGQWNKEAEAELLKSGGK